MPEVQLKINGNPVTAEYAPEMTLLQYLRNVACLRGAKEGCGTGHCGACSVLINGRVRRACVTKLQRLEGADILTIEGLSTGDELHPIQKAYLDVGAIQCGYCTPGMILATNALLDRNPNPARGEILKALKHNYCRCTGYVKIIEAVELAARWLSGEENAVVTNAMEKTTIVTGTTGAEMEVPQGKAMGISVWDMDGIAKARGTLKYTDDYVLPSMLYGGVIWSGEPHARIIHIDAAEALAMDGVTAVITAKDVPGINGFGLLTPDQPVFCDKEVNFIADVVAVVVAEDEYTARTAAKKVKVEYEPMPGIFEIDQAENQNSIFKEISYAVGDVDGAKNDPDLLKLRLHYDIPRQEHACMETESAIGVWNPDGMTVYCTTQSPYEVREMLSAVLKMNVDQIRIIAPPLGGAFGKKCDPYMEAAAAVASYMLQRPVKITLNREESLNLSTKRHPYKIDYEIGLRKDGRIHFVDAYFKTDAGPYRNLSPGVLEQSMIFCCGPYRIPNGRVQGKALKTNNTLSGAFRGFGINQAAISIEVALDIAAEKLGIDPFELRLRNAVDSGDVTFSGQRVEYSVGIRDTVALCRDRMYEVLKDYEGQYPNGTKVLGWGMASGYKNVGVGKGVPDDGGAILTKTVDGKIELRVSGIDMGQGFRTAMRQLAAEALDEGLENIYLINGDTNLTPKHGQAVSERQTLNSGNAVVRAAKLLREKLEQDPWKQGKTRSARYDYVAPKTYALHDHEGRIKAGVHYRNYPSYAYTTQGVILEVDTASGKIKVLKIVAVHDVGRAINPHIIEGQIEGSCSMGIGYALTEHFDVVEGRPTEKYYGKLGMPTIDETPEYELILVEDPEPEGPFGAKGISEVATVPMTPAIMNAVYRATGLRFFTLPITPEAVLDGLRKGNP
jgi:CO/xanthine dehydrogenase Mo-binding subunit/aerobic-type carbon monoxide dehydrogenase small subunit (CoxS/CutS family)